MATKRRGVTAALDADQVETQLRLLATEIEDTDAALRALWVKRTELYRAGIDLGMSKAAIGRAAGVTKEAVIHALKRTAPAAG